MEEKRSYYAIIPANVRYDKGLSANAKLLYGEITALCNEKGYCWSTNKYFAELYGVSQTSISKWISTLVSKGYLFIKIIYREGTKEILERRLSIDPIEEKFNTPLSKVKDPIEEKLNTPLSKVKDPIEEKFNPPIEEKLKENNTETNTTVNKSVSQSKEKKKTDELTDKIRESLKRQIEYDYFEDNFPEDLTGVDALIDCITEMLSRPSTKINGIAQSRETLEACLSQVDSCTVLDFLDHMKKQDLCGIRNLNAYYKSSLINFIREQEIRLLNA